MDEQKGKMQHFLANVFTSVNFELMELAIPDGTKKRLLHLIRQASMVITNEELFLDQVPEFVRQDISLSDIIEVAIAMQQDLITADKKDVGEFKEKIMVNADRFYFDEALKELVGYLVDKSHTLNFVYSADQHSLTFELDKDLELNPAEDDLIELLHREHLYDRELSYQFALKILKLHGNNVEISKGSLKLFL